MEAETGWWGHQPGAPGDPWGRKRQEGPAPEPSGGAWRFPILAPDVCCLSPRFVALPGSSPRRQYNVLLEMTQKQIWS